MLNNVLYLDFDEKFYAIAFFFRSAEGYVFKATSIFLFLRFALLSRPSCEFAKKMRDAAAEILQGAKTAQNAERRNIRLTIGRLFRRSDEKEHLEFKRCQKGRETAPFARIV